MPARKCVTNIFGKLKQGKITYLDVLEAYLVPTAFLSLRWPNNGFFFVKCSNICTADSNTTLGYFSAFFCVVTLEVLLDSFEAPGM